MARKKAIRNISIPQDLAAWLDNEAARNHRPFSWQVEYLLGKARELISLETAGTQISMPTTAEERAAMLERVR